nr:tetratricopeptide repeat protein [Candidatus Sigynarchaeota archaeon]
MGTHYIFDQKKDEAEARFLECIEYCHITHDEKEELNARSWLGTVYSAKEMYEKSLEQFKAAEALAAKLGDKKALAQALTGSGKAYFQMLKKKEALECFVRAANLYVELRDKMGRSSLDFWLTETPKLPDKLPEKQSAKQPEKKP